MKNRLLVFEKPSQLDSFMNSKHSTERDVGIIAPSINSYKFNLSEKKELLRK